MVLLLQPLWGPRYSVRDREEEMTLEQTERDQDGETEIQGMRGCETGMKAKVKEETGRESEMQRLRRQVEGEQ